MFFGEVVVVPICLRKLGALIEHRHIKRDEEIHAVLTSKFFLDDKKTCAIHYDNFVISAVCWYVFISDIPRGRFPLPNLQSGSIIRTALPFTLCDLCTGNHLSIGCSCF